MARAAAPPQSLPPRPIPPLSSPSALPILISEPSAPRPASIIKPSNNSQNYSQTVFHISVSSQSIRPRLQAVLMPPVTPHTTAARSMYSSFSRGEIIHPGFRCRRQGQGFRAAGLWIPVKAKVCPQFTTGASLSAANRPTKAKTQGPAKVELRRASALHATLPAPPGPCECCAGQRRPV